MAKQEHVIVNREVEAVMIPDGVKTMIPKDTPVVITQALGTSYTVIREDGGGLLRIDQENADALGKEVSKQGEVSKDLSLDQQIWTQLKTCYDPEIPVNIVDLGLIYEMAITDFSETEKKVDIKMTLTAPGCGMGDILKTEIEDKIYKLNGIKAVEVEMVFDPPWDRSRMSEAAKLELGMFGM